MTDDGIREMIAAQRLELAAMLSELSPRQWDAPTLCAGWRVREVVAHMTAPFRHSTPKALAGLVRARFDINRLMDRWARRDAASVAAAELVAMMRDNANHPWKPAGKFEAALTHDVVHGLDITVPLGIDQRVPLDRLRIVLDGMASPKAVKFFGVDLAGVQLRADDLDWSFGSGTPVHGTAADLVLVLAGRRLPTGRLRGEPGARYTGQDPVSRH
jgi:uncharacterized protein (TIGR03083 family)